MKKPKNIPLHYPSKGTPIYRDTTALPFLNGGPLVDKTNHGKLLPSVYASALGNYYGLGGVLDDPPNKTLSKEEVWKATMDWINSNPYGKMPSLDKLKEVKTNMYPKQSGERVHVPIAGIYANPYNPEVKEDYQWQIVPQAEDYQGLDIYMINGKAMVLDPEFNEKFLTTYKKNKLFGKDEIFHVYGKGTPYTTKGTTPATESFKKGGPFNTTGPVNEISEKVVDKDAMNAMMKARLAYANEFGNLAAQRMVNAPDQPYVYTGQEYDRDFNIPVSAPEGSIGTHYMASFGNYAVPFIQQGLTSLYFNELPTPKDKEAIRFENEKDAGYFGEHYKDIAPDPSYREYRNGGQFPTPYSLPEDSFKQGGNNLHNSVYASSLAQYPALYKYGGSFDMPRQQMYMPLDNVEKFGGSILSMSNTPQLEGEGKDLTYPDGAYAYGSGGMLKTSHLFAAGGFTDPPQKGIITYKSDPNLVNSTANFDMISKVPISQEYNEQIKHRLYTGNYGFNPETGELIALPKTKQVEVPAEIKNIRAKEEDTKAYNESVRLAGVGDPKLANPKTTWSDSQREEFIRQGFNKTVNNPAFKTAAYFTPIGAAIGSLEGMASLAPDLYKGDYTAATFDAAEILPFIPKGFKTVLENSKLARNTLGKQKAISELEFTPVPLESFPKLESFTLPKTGFSDLEKEIYRQADDYVTLATSAKNYERAAALDKEYGTEYVKALDNLAKHKDATAAIGELPLNIKVVPDEGTGSGGWSTFTPEGRAKLMMYNEGFGAYKPTIFDREIAVVEGDDLSDMARVVPHEIKHHYTLGQDVNFYKNQYGEQLSDMLNNPGEISKTNPVLADALIQPAFKDDTRSLFEYLEDPREIDAYINTNLRDDLVKQKVLKDHWDELTQEKVAEYLMKNPHKYSKKYLDMVKDPEFIKMFNKGVYSIAPIATGAALMDSGNKKEFKKGGTIRTIKSSQLL